MAVVMKADLSLENSLRGILKGRILLLGIGNRLRSDDAAGPLLADRLSGRVNAEVIDAGDVPENYIGPIRKLAPGVVLAVDAVRSGRSAGEVQLFGCEDIADLTSSTHDMGLGSLLDFVSRETGARVFLLGIEPEDTGFGEQVSRPVEQALERIEALLVRLLK